MVKTPCASPFHWPVRIYYEDTDMSGLVYHANYIKYFERARTEFLRRFGVNQQRLFEQKIAFVVCYMEIDFIKGARLDDELIVQTSVSRLLRASILFKQELVDAKGHCFCRAEVKIACVNPEKMKPVPLPISIHSEILSER